MRELTGGFSCIMSVVYAVDYAGSSAGRTVGSRRVAAGTCRSTLVNSRIRAAAFCGANGHNVLREG